MQKKKNILNLCDSAQQNVLRTKWKYVVELDDIEHNLLSHRTNLTYSNRKILITLYNCGEDGGKFRQEERGPLQRCGCGGADEKFHRDCERGPLQRCGCGGANEKIHRDCERGPLQRCGCEGTNEKIHSDCERGPLQRRDCGGPKKQFFSPLSSLTMLHGWIDLVA
ncbi:hypothetical protein QAD02_012899 [Eretmocerus hayati]|uniref:Uncharacterized protein n=1 Tax=Eretmocerus hayati TaxID=131215 RepID=A0ACC2P3U5_9HYME|nr:hypothetical protein QAD02_012899 [Eretmocerus hayati]